MIRHTHDMLDCGEHGIEHRITKASHLWTTGQVERRDRIIEDATVKRYQRYELALDDGGAEHLIGALAVVDVSHGRPPAIRIIF